MKIRTLLLLVVLGAIAAFAAQNWGAFTTPTALNVGFSVVQAPLGIIMLGLTAFLTVLFLVFVIYQQTSLLVEGRRHARELQTYKALADQAEASRMIELRESFDAQLRTLAEQNAETRAAIIARLDKLDGDFHSAQEQSENSIAAYMGEFEDRLARETRMPPTHRLT